MRNPIPPFAAAVWFDTFVRPNLKPEHHKIGEALYSKHHLELFDNLCIHETEFEMAQAQTRAAVLYAIVDAVLKHGYPVANQYLGRKPSETEKEISEMLKKPQTKGGEGESLGVG